MSIFSQVSAKRPKSSKFNLSEEMKLSCNFGQLIPILCKETLPGDTFRINTELLIKLAPLKAPVMHRLKAYVHYFYVPNYQISNQFERFINPKVNDGSIVMPFASSRATFSQDSDVHTLDEICGIGTLADYLGLPITMPPFQKVAGPGIAPRINFNLLPFMCYQHIYNSYYRDQNMELLPSEGGNIDTTSLFDVEGAKDLLGSIDYTDIGDNQLKNLFKLRTRAWKKDYFTSALPSPQAGADVLIPMGFDAEAIYSLDSAQSQSRRITTFMNTVSGTDEVSLSDGDGNKLNARVEGKNTTATINDLRRAMALQRFKELAERGGSRLPEIVSKFFGVYVPDYMVDRPIYLGGQATPISIGEVVQTSQSTNGEDGSAQGTRAGIASAYGRTRGVKLFAPLHGFILGILSIRPEATYSQGLERMWSRQSVFDYAWPQFANIGEQEILNKEIYCTGYQDGPVPTDDQVFGYTPRYAEYKEGHCHVAGEFRPGQSLDYWHFGRKFDNRPLLNKDFIMMDQMNYEPFNVTSEETEHVYVNLYNNIVARRPLPYFGTPSVI